MIEHRQSAPKADALPGCATPRTAEALRFPAIAVQALTALRGKTRQNMAGTVSTTPGIVPDLVDGLGLCLAFCASSDRLRSAVHRGADYEPGALVCLEKESDRMTDLIARLEAAREGDRELDAAIAVTVGFTVCPDQGRWRMYGNGVGRLRKVKLPAYRPEPKQEM